MDIEKVIALKASDAVAEAVLSRFEEGKPADPTENMSPEDAKTWREEHDKNKDRFKEARSQDATVFMHLRPGVKVKIEAQGLPKPRVLDVQDKPLKMGDSGRWIVSVSSGKPWGSGRMRGGILQYSPEPMYSRESDEIAYQPTMMQKPLVVTNLEVVSEQEAERLMHAAEAEMTPEDRVAMQFEAQTKVAPEQVDKYFKQVKKDNPGYSDAQGWATAWSIYCAHKNPGSPSCHQDSYFPGKTAGDPDWKGTAEKLLRDHKGSDQDAFHYRAYMRAVIQGVPTKHLVEKYPGAKAAQQDLIDEAGKAPKTASDDLEQKVKKALKWLEDHGKRGEGVQLLHEALAQLRRKKPGIEESVREILESAVEAYDIPGVKTAARKTAGYSYRSDPMSVLFVESKKPFNADTIQDINRTMIPILADDGEEHDVFLKFVRQESSGPLTHAQEQQGWKREVRVDILHPIDDEGSPNVSARAALSAIVAVGKKHGFRVEPVKAGYQPQTRKASSMTYQRVAAEEAPDDELKDDKEDWLPGQKRGEWNLILSKYSASRWNYYLKNPHGGGGGSSSYPNPKAAFAAGTRNVAWGEESVNPGKKKIWVIEQVWDWDKDDYVAKKSYWWDIPDNLLATKFRQSTREEQWDALTR